MGVYERKARILRPTIEPGRRVLVVSDIHANLPYFHGVLDKVGFSDEDLLILNGDFLEKGRESLKTLHEVMAMCKKGNVIPLMGNCDDWAAMYREDSRWSRGIPHYMAYRKSGLLWEMTLELGEDPMHITDFEGWKRRLAERFPEEFAFLDALPHGLETDKYIFVHAAMYPDKPLGAHRTGELVRCDAFYESDYVFDKWVVVGHYPVVLYGQNIVCANPIIDRERHIVSIDGGCVLKDDGQLNCLIIPDITGDEITFDAYDPFPVRRVLSNQAASPRSYYIRWGDSRVQVLRRGKEFSRCRHVRTGYEMDILTKYLFEPGEYTDCNDCTDYVLPLKAGDLVSVVEETSRGYFVKHKGVSGWYFGELE